MAAGVLVLDGRPGSGTDPLAVALAEVPSGKTAGLEQAAILQNAATFAFTTKTVPRMSTALQTCMPGAGGAAGPLPLNYVTIVNFLIGHGYTPIAAAGIAGNIYQESGGNPESGADGDGGLIGWTPLPAGYLTGDAAADLQTQLAGLLIFNDNLGEFIPALNAATTPADAAFVYMTDFERPSFPAASNREDAAIAVASACGFTS